MSDERIFFAENKHTENYIQVNITCSKYFISLYIRESVSIHMQNRMSVRISVRSLCTPKSFDDDTDQIPRSHSLGLYGKCRLHETSTPLPS